MSTEKKLSEQFRAWFKPLEAPGTGSVIKMGADIEALEQRAARAEAALSGVGDARVLLRDALHGAFDEVTTRDLLRQAVDKLIAVESGTAASSASAEKGEGTLMPNLRAHQQRKAAAPEEHMTDEQADAILREHDIDADASLKRLMDRVNAAQVAPTPPAAPLPLCAICGKEASCFGLYESMERGDFACDECCQHGCEDGRCVPVARACEGGPDEDCDLPKGHSGDHRNAERDGLTARVRRHGPSRCACNGSLRCAMADPKAILDGCNRDHVGCSVVFDSQGRTINPCRPCALRAIEAAIQNERERAVDAIERDSDVCVADDCGHGRCDYARRYIAAIRARRSP